MNVIAVNGSPRKKWNTATLLEHALEGAASKGAATELVHLYDLEFKGCVSCFACKTRDGESYGKCAVKDDLMPLFTKLEEADGVILGSPIYLGTVTGEMRSFMERWVFQYLTYTDPPRSLFPRKIRTGFIYTMNLTGEELDQRNLSQTYESHYTLNEIYLDRVFGPGTRLTAMDTCQFEDYSKVVADRWDPEAKARSRREVFPLDCQRAWKMGADMIVSGRD